jgi:xylose isomerase
VKEFKKALSDTGIAVPMATTNLFTNPIFKDGAFTSNDPKVRAYALQKTMNAIDLGVELGAKLYVFWGGREGTETDSSKDPVDAIKRNREAMNFLCEYVLDNKYDLKFALEAKPNEPRADIYNPTTGHMLAFIETLDHPEMVGVNPEMAHEHMAGLNFMHGVAQAWEAGKLFHIDLNDQYPGRFDQDLRFGSRDIKAAFYLVKFLEDVGYSGSRQLTRRLPHRRREGVERLCTRLHAHLPDPEGKGRTVPPGQGHPNTARRNQRQRRLDEPVFRQVHSRKSRRTESPSL